MKGLALAISTLLVAWPASASTYTWNISFGPPIAHVSGTIVTDCDNCAVMPSDILSWTFTGSDGVRTPQTVSSTDLGVHLWYTATPGVAWPLNATSSTIYWNYSPLRADGSNYVPRFDGSDPQVCFCGYNGMWFGYDDTYHDTSYIFSYADNSVPQHILMTFNVATGSGNWIMGNLSPSLPPGQCGIEEPVCITTPLPSTWLLFLTGLFGLFSIKKRVKV